MRPTLLVDTIKARYEAHLAGKLKRAMYIEGLPGLGKTQIPRQVAQTLGIGFMPIHAPLMQPEDYGMPVVNAAKDGVAFVVPTEKFPIVGSDSPDEGILLIDELPQSDNSGQKILGNLLQEREIHGKRLKPGWMIVATGNPTTARAGANRILSHLSDRLTRYALEPHMDDWCSYALSTGVPIEVPGFIRFRPNLLCDFDPHREKNATPRGWIEGVGASLGNVPHEAEYETFQGDVGEGAASEFVAFVRIFRKLPNPDVVLLSPDTHEVPADQATRYALAVALAHRASPVNFDRIMTYAKRMPPEFMTLVVRNSIIHDRSVQNTKAFIDWAANEGAKVLL